jgi:outer membrane protein TolC
VRWVALTFALLASPLAFPAKGALESFLIDASKKNPKLRSIREEYRAAQAEAMSARGNFDPKLSSKGKFDLSSGTPAQIVDSYLEQPIPFTGMDIRGGWRYGVGDIQPYEEGSLTAEQGEVYAELRAPLIRSLIADERRVGLWNAKLEEQRRKDLLEAETIDLNAKISSQFFKTLAAVEKQKARQDILDLAQTRLAFVKRIVRSGQQPKIAVVDNLRLITKRRADLEKAKQKRIEVEMDLFLFAQTGESRAVKLDSPGWAWPDFKRLEKDLPALEAEGWRRPDFAAQMKRVEQTKNNVTLGFNNLLPEVNAIGRVGQDIGTGQSKLLPTEWSVGLEIELPLTFRKERGKLASARAKRNKQEASLEWLKQQFDTEWGATAKVIERLLDELEQRRVNLDSSKKVAEAERRSFAVGSSSLVEVNLREEAEAQAAFDLADTKLRLSQYLVRLHALSGHPNIALRLYPPEK